MMNPIDPGPGSFTLAKQKKVYRDIPCLEYGKPKSETKWVRAYSWPDAIKKAQAGKGTKLTAEEVKKVWR